MLGRLEKRAQQENVPLPTPSAGGRGAGPRSADVVGLENVSRRYPHGGAEVRALDGVTLAVGAGEMVAVVGPSGCGKSTLLNVIAGVDRADAGRVVVCGLDLAGASERELLGLRRRAVGVVFQAFHLLANLTARENVALPLALAGSRDDARVEELLARVGLAGRMDHKPSELSGGEEQRVALARALVHRPRVVVADEPTGNLDQRSGASILALLDELRRAEGAALVLATHDPHVAGRADRIVSLLDGRVVGATSRAGSVPGGAP